MLGSIQRPEPDLASPAIGSPFWRENCPEYVDCYYGVPGAGMALTLLNYRLAPRELAYIIANSGPRVLITESKYLPSIRRVRVEIPSVERIVLIDGEAEDCMTYDEFVASGAPTEPVRLPAETDLCWLLYTSGTTGLPKRRDAFPSQSCRRGHQLHDRLGRKRRRRLHVHLPAVPRRRLRDAKLPPARLPGGSAAKLRP